MTRPWRGTLLYSGALAAVALAAVTRFAGSSAAETTTPTATGTTTSAGATAGTSTSTGSPTATSGTASASATATSVVITGDAVSMRYGTVQVAVTFTGGVITAVQTLQSPTGHQSDQINANATPILAAEAVKANSATIDTVSGATFTSQAYEQSLQSAIDRLG